MGKLCLSVSTIIMRITGIFKLRAIPENIYSAINYDEYILSRKEFAAALLSGIAIDFMLSIIFFNSFLLTVVLFPIVIGWIKYVKNNLCRRRIQKLNIEFKDGIEAVVSALHAGYSVENAFKSAWKELCVLDGEESDIAIEFRKIANSTDINRNIDVMLLDFGERSGIQDIKSFAEVFSISRKSGGQLIQTVTNTIGTISSRIQVKAEINGIISGKKYEQNIMMIVPPVILLYLRFAAYSFIDVLYTTLSGRMVMTVCLIFYIAAFVLGNKICDIEIK